MCHGQHCVLIGFFLFDVSVSFYLCSPVMRKTGGKLLTKFSFSRCVFQVSKLKPLMQVLHTEETTTQIKYYCVTLTMKHLFISPIS